MRKPLFAFVVAVILCLGYGPTLVGKFRESAVKLPEFLTQPAEETGRRSVMFIFGHFDDDSAVSGTMNMFVRAGWEVNSVWVTSAGTGSIWWGTTTERRAEMEKAMDIVGLPKENRHVLGVPDREAVNFLPQIADAVTELVKKYQPSLVITCAYEGGHWDHDSTCLAGYVVSRRVDFKFARFEFPTYNASGPKLMPYKFNSFITSYGPPLYVPLDQEAWKVSRKVRYAYSSQWFLMLPEDLLQTGRHIAGKGELIRPTPDYNFLQPPHPGRLYLQSPLGVHRGVPFKIWEQAVRGLPEFQGAP